ncbi:hypothetical protein KAI92_01695 [Candidatus Parcubacteria bacterium]|nr:hypothetical protein [Candidatus Parcubacteria bacterium]
MVDENVGDVSEHVVDSEITEQGSLEWSNKAAKRVLTGKRVTGMSTKPGYKPFPLKGPINNNPNSPALKSISDFSN